MNLDDLNKKFQELQNLDPKNIGSWPLFARILTLLVIFVVVVGAGYWFVIRDQQAQLAEDANKEISLKKEFEDKASKAANLATYKKQLDEMTKSFGTMLRQLPGRTEIPSLLQDISQTAQVDGLKQNLFQPENEIRKDFYAEKPIRIVVEGNYHEFGKFVSDVAALPRIVTVHDIDIKPQGANAKGNNLVMTLTAKTYRYLEGNEGGTKGSKGRGHR
ncbi:MAG TPA: type 4a pilus biogenesis protein PilO [Gammaproteobacteria bacterium]|nr:type 4a pilus biogenesis protein PilO [Gammaproteobacteria bacterium]